MIDKPDVIITNLIYKMMKWTRLQLNKLPIIAIEADGAIERLEGIYHHK